MRLRPALAALVLVAVLGGGDASPQPSGSGLVTLDYPGAAWSFAASICDRGTIVGQYCDTGGYNCRAFRRTWDGVFTTIAGPDGTSALGASGVNARGEIVGGLEDRCGFLLSGGTYTRICVPGAWTTEATGINAQGDSVGNYRDSSGPHGFLLRDGVFTTIDHPDGETGLRGINSRGDIVLTCYFGSACGLGRSFLWRDGVFTEIAFPGASFTEVLGINDRGDVVGGYGLGGWGRTQAFLLRDGRYTDIAVPAYTSEARGINNRGQVVGGYREEQYTDPHGFLTSVR